MECSLNTETNRRIVWHQSSHCWVVASVRIGELGLCIGRLFKCVIVLWMACSSPSLSGEGVRPPLLFSKVSLFCSLFLGPLPALQLLLSLLCRSARIGQKKDFVTLLPPLCPSFLSLLSLSQIFPHQPSCFAVTQRCWNITVALSRILVFPQISHRRLPPPPLSSDSSSLSLELFNVHLGSQLESFLAFLRRIRFTLGQHQVGSPTF